MVEQVIKLFTQQTFTNLTVSGSGTKTLNGGTTVTGVLTLTNGVLSSTTDNLLSITNTATSAISGGSATAYINGPVKWTLPASLTSGSTYVFPVGKSGNYKPFSLVKPYNRNRYNYRSGGGICDRFRWKR
jgi:hypothetical protein